jgi:predicted metal-dependent hydrolase
MRGLLQFTLPTDAPASSTFTHPRASREVRLKDTQVAYEFTRGKRRTIGFMVGAEGLSVRAPSWVTLKDVDKVLQDKAEWILRKLDETRHRHERVEASRIVWADGAQFPFLGQPVVIRLDSRRAPGRITAVLEAGEDAAGQQVQALPTLHLSLTHDASETQVRDAVLKWIAGQARQLFIERMNHFASQLGVQWSKLSLSNAATRWGSASADGSIRLNWRLIHFGLPVIDYVVAHELSHLRVMNHSKRFWDTVATVVPDYPALRQQLKDEAVPRW